MLQIAVLLVELPMVMFFMLSSLLMLSVLAQIVLTLVLLLVLPVHHVGAGERVLSVIRRRQKSQLVLADLLQALLLLALHRAVDDG